MTMLREAFERDGVVRVPNVIDGVVLRTMREALRERIAGLEFTEVAGAMRPALGTELTLWDMGRAEAFAPLPAAFATALERVFGRDVWTQIGDELGGYAMPNRPCPDANARPCAVAWHVDEPISPGRERHHRLIGYALLDRVESGGGATVMLTRSHQRLAALADELGTQCTTDVVRAELPRTEPWFADLFEPAGTPVAQQYTSAGIPLKVHELTGDAGDFILLNPCCLHTTSANVSPRPRLIMRLTGVRV